MTLTLDSATQERIERELARGTYREPAEVIAHALELLDAERTDLQNRRAAFGRRLEGSFAQSERGETYSPDDAQALLAERRAARQ